MKEYLTVGNAIAFILIYIAVNFYFLYQQNKAREVRRLDIDRAVQALSKAVEAQEASIKNLEQLVVKTFPQKGK